MLVRITEYVFFFALCNIYIKLFIYFEGKGLLVRQIKKQFWSITEIFRTYLSATFIPPSLTTTTKKNMNKSIIS